MKISKTLNKLNSPEQNLCLRERFVFRFFHLLDNIGHISTICEWKHKIDEVGLLFNEINSKNIWVLHILHNLNFKFSIIDRVTLNNFVLLKHFDSIVLVSGRKFTQENSTKSSLSYNCKHLKIIDIHSKFLKLRFIRNLLTNEYMEWSVSSDASLFFSQHFLIFLFFTLRFSELLVQCITSCFLKLKFRNNKHSLSLIRIEGQVFVKV